MPALRGIRRWVVATAMVIALVACGASPSPAGTVGTWTLATPMPERRAMHSATTLLPSGLVLVAGGYEARDALGNGPTLASAALYDPVTRAWTATGAMRNPRSWHAAVLLLDGRVLVAGGCGENLGEPVGDGQGSLCITDTSAEIYDPAAGSWETTGSMGHRRAGDGVLLSDGTVLVAGSWQYRDASPGAFSEVYDPATGTWEEVGPMVTARMGPTMVRLGDGRVLAVGGWGALSVVTTAIAAAEIYDPATKTWSATAPFHMPILGNTLTLLPTGRVLLTGGCYSTWWPCVLDLSGGPESKGWLFNPDNETWGTTGPMRFVREFASAVLMDSGNVLVAGGNTYLSAAEVNSAPAAEVYDSWRDVWTPTPVIPHYVNRHAAAALLPSGDVLFTGGEVFNGIDWTYDNLKPISAAQLYRE